MKFHPRVVEFLEKVLPVGQWHKLGTQERLWLTIFRETYDKFQGATTPRLTRDESYAISALAICELHEPTTTNVRLMCCYRHKDVVRRSNLDSRHHVAAGEQKMNEHSHTIAADAAEELVNILKKNGRFTRACELVHLVYIEGLSLEDAKVRMGLSRQHYYQIKRTIIETTRPHRNKFRLAQVKSKIPSMAALQTDYEIRLAI